MNRSPELVLTAIGELHAQPEGCVLSGDSLTEIDAARAAGVPTIGYANKPYKYFSLSSRHCHRQHG